MSTEPTAATPQSEPAPSASPIDQHAAPVADTRRRPGRAIAALILGIIALLGVLIPILGVILGVIAIVLGATARSDIKRSGLEGAGQATAGMILGGIAVVVALGIWIAAIAANT